MRPHHVGRAGALRAYPHRIALEVHPHARGSGPVEHLPLHPQRPHAHREVGLHRIAPVSLEREAPAPRACERPGRCPRVEVDAGVGVYARQVALHRPGVTALRGVEPVRALARALREHHPCEQVVPLGVEAEQPRGHVAVRRHVVGLRREPAGAHPPPCRERRSFRFAAPAREVERAPQPQVVGGDGAGLLFAPGALRPAGQCLGQHGPGVL